MANRLLARRAFTVRTNRCNSDNNVRATGVFLIEYLAGQQKEDKAENKKDAEVDYERVKAISDQNERTDVRTEAGVLNQARIYYVQRFRISNIHSLLNWAQTF